MTRLGELNVSRVAALFVFDSCSLPPPTTNNGIISTPEPDLTHNITHKSPNADLSHLNTTPIYPDGIYARLGRQWRTLFRSRICQ